MFSQQLVNLCPQIEGNISGHRTSVFTTISITNHWSYKFRAIIHNIITKSGAVHAPIALNLGWHLAQLMSRKCIFFPTEFYKILVYFAILQLHIQTICRLFLVRLSFLINAALSVAQIYIGSGSHQRLEFNTNVQFHGPFWLPWWNGFIVSFTSFIHAQCSMPKWAMKHDR